MKNFIAIVEGMQTYYHGSRARFAIGTILTAQKEGYAHDDYKGADEAHTRLEQELEKYRPTGAPARAQSVYMVTDPDEIDRAGGYDDQVYIVDPIGPIWKANLAWYGELYQWLWDDVSDETIHEYATNYWNAVPKGDGDIYEYLVGSARVEKQI